MVPAVLETPNQAWTFERFLAESPDLTELIDGEIYEVAGVTELHDRVQFALRTAFGLHCRRIEFGRVFGDSFVMRIDEKNGPIPDVHVYANSRKEQLHYNYADAPADLAIEVVSPSNRGADLSRKLGLYERAGVREYWVIDAERRTGTYYLLTENGVYHSFRPEPDGKVHSHVVTGFAIPETWLFDPPEIDELVALLV